MPSTARSGPASVARSRLLLIVDLLERGIAPALAQSTVDRWLLVGLAAELLGLGGAGGALGSAEASDFGPLLHLTEMVEQKTGLPAGVEPEVSAQLTCGRQAPLPFPAFSSFRKSRDPLGVLGQHLRATSALEHEGDWGLRASDARRDTGGYYTPYALARSLADQALAGFEEVPSVIDPSCGAGTFLSASFDALHSALDARRRRAPADGIEPVAWTVAALHGVEIDPIALLATRLSIATRAILAERLDERFGQMALFGQSVTYGPLIIDRIRLGDSLSSAPTATLGGTERLYRRLQARDTPGRSPQPRTVEPIVWDAAFPQRFSNEEGTYRSGGFGLVITNPPFVPVDRIPETQRRALMASLSTAQRRFDLFIGFVERALTLLEPGGRATLLIPRTFLSEANAELCRQLLLSTATIERIEDLGAVAFDEAKVPCVAITFVARKPNEESSIEIVQGGRTAQVPQRAFRLTQRQMWRIELAEPQAAECLRISEQSVPLGRYFCAAWGARGSPVSDFHLDAPGHPLARPMLKADDVQPLRINPTTRWLLYDTERLYRPARREFFESEKLLVRKVTGARGLVCAVDAEKNYTDDSLACVVRKADLASIPKHERARHKIEIAPGEVEPSRAYDLHLVAALLQTPLIQRYYRVMLGGGLNVFPELIEALPLPPPDRMAWPEAKALAAMARAGAHGAPIDVSKADEQARKLYGLVSSGN
jgi:hypothetical protein